MNLVNASYLIASSLPPSFTIPSSKEQHAANRRVCLHVHPAPIPVSYASVRESLPTILDEFAASHGGQRPDLVVHIGIASPRPYYSVETLAHRDNYTITDINGCSGYEDGEKRWRQMGLPPVLIPGSANEGNSDMKGPYPPDDYFLQTWKSFAPADSDLRLSKDAGHYLCDFIFYTSLSLALQKGQDRNVLFLHVPGASEDADIERGCKITLALIKAMVTCWIDGKHSA